jgi:hypothetical protein
LNDAKREASRTFSKKKWEYLKEKNNELEINMKKKYQRFVYRQK